MLRLLLRRDPRRLVLPSSPLLEPLGLLHRRPLTGASSATPPPDHDPDAAFTVSYLTSSCGLPLSTAISLSSSLRLKPTHKHDSVLALFRRYGLSPPQIASVVAKQPKLLVADPDHTIMPKLDLFLSFGYSHAELAAQLAADPSILRVSHAKRMLPNLTVLKSLLGSDVHVRTAVRGSSRLLRLELEKMLIPNLETLRQHGVPADKIAQLLTLYPRVVTQKKSDRLAATVSKLKELGMNPLSTTFILGINAMSGLSQSTWERKLALYKSLGWTEKDTLLAFTRHPFCMLVSDQKIKAAMAFFVEKLHWEPVALTRQPKLISLSLEKRIIPRCAVLSVLASKGSLRRKAGRVGLFTRLLMPEKQFLEKYVIKYAQEIPEVLDAYEGKIEFVGLKEMARQSNREQPLVEELKC